MMNNIVEPIEHLQNKHPTVSVSVRIHSRSEYLLLPYVIVLMCILDTVIFILSENERKQNVLSTV
jgi:hypothetical protein